MRNIIEIQRLIDIIETEIDKCDNFFIAKVSQAAVEALKWVLEQPSSVDNSYGELL